MQLLLAAKSLVCFHDTIRSKNTASLSVVSEEDGTTGVTFNLLVAGILLLTLVTMSEIIFWTGLSLSLNKAHKTNPAPAYKARSKVETDLINSSKVCV
jgi:hypothetical protein